MVRYRTEDAYGEGYRDIIDVIEHEIFELGNYDGLDGLQVYFDDTSQESLMFHSLIDSIKDTEHPPLDTKDFCASIIELLNKKLNRNLKYCLWLADLQAVTDLYGGVHIDSYETSDVVIADLGYDGSLYAYEELPLPISQFNSKATLVVKSDSFV